MIKRTFTIAIVGWFGVALAFAQNTQYTKNSADETLRSTGRVNPASLAMEMDVPVGQYPGRGINLPLGLSYSSKVWRFQEYRTYQLNNDSQRIYAEAKFGEDSAAGWTSSLSQPYIEYVGEQNRFDQEGKPLPGEMDMPGGPAPYGNIFVKRIMVFLPGGASHELRAAEEPIWLTGGMAPDESVWNTTFYAVDGSGLKYVQDSTATPAKYELWLPDGSRYDFNPTREDKGSTDVTQIRRGSRLTDVKGNYVQFNVAATGYPNGSWTDQLGRTFPVMIPRETPTLAPTAGVLEQSFTLPGMSEPYVLRWKRLKGATAADSAFTDFGTQVLKYPGHTNMDYQNPTSYSPSLFTGGPNPDYRMNQCSFNYLYIGNQGFPAQLFNPVVLAEIVLPNGAEYEFTYNEFGEIEQVRYPAGGSEMITYAPVPSLADLAKPYQQSNRGVTERRIYENDADSSPDTWTYSAESSTNNYRTSTIAPDGTRTDRFMHRAAPPPTICPSEYTVNYYRGTRYGYDNALNGMAYEERRFSSAGQLVNRTFTRWGVTKTTVGFVAEPGNPSRINWGTQAQRNARTLSTESITYDGDTGLSAVGTVEYETGEDALGSPLNVTKTTQYAFKVVSGGGSVAPGEAPPVNAVTLTDPSSGATPVRMTTVTYMSSDPAYSQTVKDGYAANNIRKLATATQTKNGTGSVTAAQTEIRYDEPTYGNAYRGQPTTARSWLDTTSSWIETRTKYDAYGNATESTDANGNTSTTVYDPTYNAFPVQVTSPIPSDGTHGSGTAFVTTMTYNPVTGQVLTATDPNGLKTKIEYVDPMLRPTRVAAYDSFDQQVGAATETSYGAGTDSSSRWVKTRSQIDATNWKESYVWYDGLGRTTKTQSVDPNGDVFVETEFDIMSRPKRVTNPYRNGETVYWTESVFDTAGRPWKTITPGGATVTTTYSVAAAGSNIGTVVTVADQAGKLRRSVTNALGHVTRVDEPNNAGQLGAIDAPIQPTFYTYDLLNNLTQVQQPGDNNEECGPSTTTCSQTRSFQYDSLSRLKQATNPERGTINYGYDSNGNLETKTDARGIVTTYAYDALNRVKTRQYTNEPSGSETPDVSYYYDNITNGKRKLIKVESSVSTTEYSSFDILGRVTASRQTTHGVTYGNGTTDSLMTYSYNLSGALVEQQYPSGRRVQNTIDSNGDLEMVRSRKNASSGYWAYANNFTYNAAGAVTSMQLGNGRWESTTFNSRLQPTEIALGVTPGAANLLDLDYAYGTTANNGNVLSHTITVAGVGAASGFTAAQNYNYDPLNRLKDATENITPTGGSQAQSWKQTFTFDRYGNRRFDEANTTMPASFANPAVTNPTVSTSNNRLSSTGWSYDPSGNTTADPQGRTFVYDAENMQVVVSDTNGMIGEYFYDGDGKRVKKHVPSTGETTVFVYDAAGKLVEEYSTAVAPTNEAKVAYLTNDHLGSPRINTDANGAVIARHDYHPFGEEIATPQRTTGPGYTDDSLRKQFTGYELDNEINLDFAEARYYNPMHGRFTSPDPLLASAMPGNPQSWNRYIYVGNNPLVITDPTGLSWYYNSAEDRYKWFGDNDTVEDGFTSVVGTRGNDDRGVGSFVYQTENGWVRLNPYTNSFSTFDTRDAATSDFSSVYQCNCQGLVNTIADESVRKGTTVALAAGTAVVIGTGAGVVMAATGTAAGAGITTLGLTSAGTSTAATTATAATATALPQFANSTVTQAVRTVMSDPNKIHHIFNNAGHGLGRLTQQLGGQSNTIRAVVNAANGSLPSSGNFVTNVVVNGTTVTVRGSVVNGTIRIGTMFVP